MSRGEKYELTGILLDSSFFPILRIAEGGDWRLDMGGRYRQFLGRRVRVIGYRSEFDMLDVEHIELA